MGAEDARGVALVLADGTRMIEQRSEIADADREVGSQQVLAEIIEEDPPDRRLEERGAARVARRVPRVLVFLAEFHEGGGERREQYVQVAAHRGVHASADEGGRVLE